MGNHPGQSPLSARVAELRAVLSNANPYFLAANTATLYQETRSGEGVFQIQLWGSTVNMSFPGFIASDRQAGNELPPYLQALLAYYFQTSNGTPVNGRWVSFADLPDGRFYNQAFQGYTGKELVKVFDHDLASLEQAALSINGRREAIGNIAFSFYALPRVPVLMVYWRGDEEFPSTCQMLFDESAHHHLPTDVCAILGSSLTGKLIRTREQS